MERGREKGKEEIRQAGISDQLALLNQMGNRGKSGCSEMENT